jgi:ferredoxin-NADP reductase
MAKYEVKLTRRIEVAVGTMAFFFEKPAGFVFKAGQNCDFTLINPPETDAEGNTRAFSLTGAPFEPEIQITTRMRDTAFKRVLKTMPIGTPLQFDGPMGSMTLQNDMFHPAVFLAGGIGITPFVSMVRQAAHEKLPHKIFLFYSNRRPADAAYLRELNDLQNENRNYRLVATMTQADEDVWDGETGYVDGKMLQKYVGDVLIPIYYLAGPPIMTAAMRAMLVGIGVNEDNVKAEDFSGY